MILTIRNIFLLDAERYQHLTGTRLVKQKKIFGPDFSFDNFFLLEEAGDHFTLHLPILNFEFRDRYFKYIPEGLPFEKIGSPKNIVIDVKTDSVLSSPTLFSQLEIFHHQLALKFPQSSVGFSDPKLMDAIKNKYTADPKEFRSMEFLLEKTQDLIDVMGINEYQQIMGGRSITPSGFFLILDYYFFQSKGGLSFHKTLHNVELKKNIDLNDNPDTHTLRATEIEAQWLNTLIPETEKEIWHLWVKHMEIDELIKLVCKKITHFKDKKRIHKTSFEIEVPEL